MSLILYAIHEHISIDLIASPEPSYHYGEEYPEHPRIGDTACSDIVEREEDNLRDEKLRERDISLDECDISPDEPPDKTRSTHDEPDIGEGVSKRDKVGWSECIICEEKSCNHSSKECIREKSAHMGLSHKWDDAFMFFFPRLLVDFIEWEDNDEPNNVEDQSYEKWDSYVDTREQWQADNEKYWDQCDIPWYFRCDFSIVISPAEYLERLLQEDIRNPRIEGVAPECHADCADDEAPESIREDERRWREYEKNLGDDECIFLTISVCNHPCWHLHDHARNVSDTTIESDLARMGIGECEKIHRKNRYKIPPSREIDEEVFPEIGFDSGEFHYWMTGNISSSATADIEFFGDPSISLSE